MAKIVNVATCVNVTFVTFTLTMIKSTKKSLNVLKICWRNNIMPKLYKKVELFETSDGKTFSDPLDAQSHGVTLEWKEWYDNNHGDVTFLKHVEEDHPRRVHIVPWGPLSDWLIKHERWVKNFYNVRNTVCVSDTIKPD